MTVLAIAASAMNNDLQRLRTISVNLANAGTPGFQRLIHVQSADSGTPAAANPATTQIAPLAPAAESHDPTPGGLRATGRPLDLAVTGNAYLEVMTPTGARYVRSGSFRADAQGLVVLGDQQVLQSLTGDLVARTPGAPLSVDTQGMVLQDGEPLAQLRLIGFDSDDALVAEGGGLFRMREDATAHAPKTTSVHSGHLLTSNVQTANEMVRLLETVRHFEALQRVVQSYDGAIETAVRKLGEL